MQFYECFMIFDFMVETRDAYLIKVKYFENCHCVGRSGNARLWDDQ